MDATTTTLRFRPVETPIGRLLIVGDDRTVQHIAPADGPGALVPEPAWTRDPSAFGGLVCQLDAYFSGQPVVFDAPFAPTGTPFQHRVWQAVAAVPFGETVTYGELARLVGRPRAMRAVAAAVGRNPLLIAVGCHRVVGGGGRPGGFRAGPERKLWLLDHETWFAGVRAAS